QRVYKMLQLAHLNGSPDGPWFFIIARNDVRARKFQLLGITDTSMLRPQVFALHDGEVQIGVIASEKQAIDAALESIAAEDPRVCPVADRYWNARGGSYTDGGAFQFSVDYSNGRKLSASNKFDIPVALTSDASLPRPQLAPKWPETLTRLKQLLDHPAETRGMPRKWYRASVQNAINEWLDRCPWNRIIWDKRRSLQPAPVPKERLVIDARGFAPEGPDSLSSFVVEACRLGWRDIILYRCRGHRFLGCGLNHGSSGVHIQIFGSSGDYLASGLDGAEIIVHGNGQDQLGQIFHQGKLVVHGDVGQTFFYGAKGGDAYVFGNAAGRPLINAVGSPRVVINGTCLDYLAESFMAGDPLQGGGFVILNGIRVNDHGEVEELPTPYPGSNLFSLASGGAIYVRDPRGILDEDQLNGGEFVGISEEDWNLFLPHLQENERLFGIRVDADLLRGKSPADVYRKIRPARSDALH
ncbi:MAG TPA: hypothetical protein VLR94_06765, partial [Acidobacteriota bacterium]|nr:hypothetical protein [Acidobacteriota bacterium]